MARKKILIATWSGDSPNTAEVIKHLRHHKYEVVMFEPDSIARGERDFSAKIMSNGAMTFTYDGQPFDPDTFCAAWYRKPNFYGGHGDTFRWLSLKDEYNALPSAIWDCFAPDMWLSSPWAIQRAEVKLTQLQKAVATGFAVPDTLITNSWQDVEAFPHDQLAVKMAKPVVITSQGTTKVLPTTIVSKHALPQTAVPYPGMWQQYLDKKREWRVTVVGEQVFAAAIYTSDDAKDDWRKQQFSPEQKVQFKKEPFPPELQTKCVALLKSLGIRYGAFDFIETRQGEILFLEVNSNGQFMWLEEQLGLPISEAIARELMHIAEL